VRVVFPSVHLQKFKETRTSGPKGHRTCPVDVRAEEAAEKLCGPSETETEFIAKHLRTAFTGCGKSLHRAGKQDLRG
jgi:hypothetical protein